MNEYITVLGDTWDVIAYKIWGKESYAMELVAANLDYVETIIFSAGVKLKIPTINQTDNSDSSLPPWKRGNSIAST